MAHLLNCVECGKEVKVPNYRVESFKFCSRSCLAKNARVQITKNCLVCGTEFTHISSRSNTAKYCSRQCYYKAGINTGTKTFSCKHCGKEFLDSPCKPRKYCSKQCVNKAEKSIWKPTFATARKALLARGKIIACEKCGYKEVQEILGVHHIDKNRKNNDLYNLIVLCPNCHSLEHRKHIPH